MSHLQVFVLSSAPNTARLKAWSRSSRKRPYSVRISRDTAPPVSTVGSLISHSSYKTQDESNTKTPQSPCPHVPLYSISLTSCDKVTSGAHIAGSHRSQHSSKSLDGDCQSHTLVFLAMPFHQGNALTAIRTTTDPNEVWMPCLKKALSVSIFLWQ